MAEITIKHDWLTSAEVCDALGINPTALGRMVKRGQITKGNSDLSTIRRYRKSDVERLAQQQEAQTS